MLAQLQSMLERFTSGEFGAGDVGDEPISLRDQEAVLDGVERPVRGAAAQAAWAVSPERPTERQPGPDPDSPERQRQPGPDSPERQPGPNSAEWPTNSPGPNSAGWPTERLPAPLHLAPPFPDPQAQPPAPAMKSVGRRHHMP